MKEAQIPGGSNVIMDPWCQATPLSALSALKRQSARVTSLLARPKFFEVTSHCLVCWSTPTANMASANSPSSSGLLPIPGTPSSSWQLYTARIDAIFRHPDMRVVIAFWLLGPLPTAPPSLVSSVC
jgi:hypothetical protein